ncbi:5-dehydro-2-deoxygluconokinase [Intrasporangium oryzae NRRL B-24470]|uniref:5-dehydro-2-deoxygluconokinase n=1 Tax=Intrasporangium oryzae NRRL B-24470 TaxID=1386089 RepID=W9GB59_9MICO|nr:5-dehydro-2-deoxygluconokinase [Intrasporangium oryzae]EWT02043.1 5-dehydro-2-deoxygluconokinase [Intrasporangium oryzae NRRL B-24470]
MTAYDVTDPVADDRPVGDDRGDDRPDRPANDRPDRLRDEAPEHRRPYDLLAIGRVGIDLYPQQYGVPLDEVRTFERFLGGSAASVTVAAARHGRRAALISRTGDDPFGRFVHRQLLTMGVDDAFVGTVRGGPPTPITFCEVFPPDHFPIWFYRHPTAPDLLIEPESLPLQAIREAGVYWSTVTGLSQEPSRSAHVAAWEERAGRTHTVLDLDYRATFWPDAATAHDQVQRALAHVTVTVGNREECAIATGETDPELAAQALVDRGVELAVVKLGRDGVLALSDSERVHVGAFPVEVVNGLGAGDAFGGALVHGLLSGWDLERVLNFANVAGAIVAGRLGCSTAMPTTAEIQTLLADVEFVEGAY